MRPLVILIGNRYFLSKAEARAEFKRILNSVDIGADISAQVDIQLLSDALLVHPEAAEKCRGSKPVRFDVNFCTGRSRCFYVTFEDGRRVHFSFNKCIDEAVFV